MYNAPSVKKMKRKTRIEQLESQVNLQTKVLTQHLIMFRRCLSFINGMANKRNWQLTNTGGTTSLEWTGEENPSDLALALLKSTFSVANDQEGKDGNTERGSTGIRDKADTEVSEAVESGC